MQSPRMTRTKAVQGSRCHVCLELLYNSEHRTSVGVHVLPFGCVCMGRWFILGNRLYRLLIWPRMAETGIVLIRRRGFLMAVGV